MKPSLFARQHGGIGVYVIVGNGEPNFCLNCLTIPSLSAINPYAQSLPFNRLCPPLTLCCDVAAFVRYGVFVGAGE